MILNLGYPTTTTNTTAPPATLSAGAIIGIAIGGAALICLLGILIICVYFNKKSKKLKQESIYQETSNRGANNFPSGGYTISNEPQLIPRPELTQPMPRQPPPPPRSYPKSAKKYEQQSRSPY